MITAFLSASLPFLAVPLQAARNFTTHRSPQQRPDLYSTERAVWYRPGTAFFYRMDLWHRGTPVLPEATRFTHHLGIRRADVTWVQFEQVCAAGVGAP
eukprot:SAG22_NODE_2013_length_3140_cov_6.228214_2_plen_98_part_00